jgi:hypothetical protein
MGCDPAEELNRGLNQITFNEPVAVMNLKKHFTEHSRI